MERWGWDGNIKMEVKRIIWRGISKEKSKVHPRTDRVGPEGVSGITLLFS